MISKESDKQMLNRNILICGATGFIGKNMLEYFGRDKHNNIIAIYNRTPPFETSHLNAKIKWIKADLCSPSEVEKIMINVDYVIQAAATTSGAKDIISSPYIHVTDNAIMNSLLLREAFENKIKHFIFFSCTVMYQSSNDVVSESDYNPNVPIYEKYFGVGNTKIYIENMLEFFSNISNMKTTAIRHSNVYGPYDKFDFDKSHVFGATVSKVMMSDKKISVWGNGEEERDLLHVNDLCEFVNKVLKNQKKKNRIYNCGLGEKISIKELVNLIISKSGKNISIDFDTSKPTIKTSLFLNCSLAYNELNWKPSINLESGVEQVIDWWKKNIDKKTLKVKV